MALSKTIARRQHGNNGQNGKNGVWKVMFPFPSSLPEHLKQEQAYGFFAGCETKDKQWDRKVVPFQNLSNLMI